MRGLYLYSPPTCNCKVTTGVKPVVGAIPQSSAKNAAGCWAPASTGTHSGDSSRLPANGFAVVYAVHDEIVPTQVKCLVRNSVLDSKRERSKR